jgi:hypothetical protein
MLLHQYASSLFKYKRGFRPDFKFYNVFERTLYNNITAGLKVYKGALKTKSTDVFDFNTIRLNFLIYLNFRVQFIREKYANQLTYGDSLFCKNSLLVGLKQYRALQLNKFNQQGINLLNNNNLYMFLFFSCFFKNKLTVYLFAIHIFSKKKILYLFVHFFNQLYKTILTIRNRLSYLLHATQYYRRKKHFKKKSHKLKAVKIKKKKYNKLNMLLYFFFTNIKQVCDLSFLSIKLFSGSYNCRSAFINISFLMSYNYTYYFQAFLLSLFGVQSYCMKKNIFKLKVFFFSNFVALFEFFFLYNIIDRYFFIKTAIILS